MWLEKHRKKVREREKEKERERERGGKGRDLANVLSKFDSSFLACSEIDECTTGMHYCDLSHLAKCENIIGGYSCKCPVGYKGNGVLRNEKFNREDGTSCQGKLAL